MIAAEGLLRALRQNDVRYVFANAGSDFAPIIEAMSSLQADQIPEFIPVAHESVAVAMAHGYWLATGDAQAVMAHVNVGLANSIMGLTNAHSDDVPIVMMAGRTPLTEDGRIGARTSPVQYGQEQFDQTGMVRDIVKWNYELRYGDQIGQLVDRAVTIARSAPQGAVYLGLPREPLCEEIDRSSVPSSPRQVAASPPVPDPAALTEAARLLENARRPLVIASRGDPEGRTGSALEQLLDHYPLPVAEVFTTRNLLPSQHPCQVGPNLKKLVADADVILVLDAPVAWLANSARPADDCKVIHIGPDPLFRRLPVRGLKTDLAISGDTTAALHKLREVLPRRDDHNSRIKELHQQFRQKVNGMWSDGATGVASKAWIGKCLSDVLSAENGVMTAERGPTFSTTDLPGGSTFFGNTQAGGLGWGFPAALGLQLADRNRLVACAMGDGSYIFANPVACLQVAVSQRLPILAVVANNAAWDAVRTSTTSVFADGAAARANKMPLVSIESPPDFAAVARGCGAYAIRVETAEALPEALNEAVKVIREERRPVVVDVAVRPE